MDDNKKEIENEKKQGTNRTKWEGQTPRQRKGNVLFIFFISVMRHTVGPILIGYYLSLIRYAFGILESNVFFSCQDCQLFV